MRTTLTIDDDVAAMLERARARSRASLKEIVNEALRQGLRGTTAGKAQRKPFRTKSVSLGRCLIGNIDSVATALAAAEGEDFR